MDDAIDYAFLHGGVQGGWVWTETLAALSAQTAGRFGRALTLDIPGCGTKRGRPTDAIGMDEIAAELIGDIEAAGLTEVVLVGHSQAGTVLPRLLALRPDLFRKVIYVSALALLPGQTALDYRAGLPERAEPAVDPEDQAALLRALFCNDMSAGETEAFMAKVGADAWPPAAYTATDWPDARLSATPASYVVCLRDACFPVTWQEVFAARLGARRLIRIDGGHQVMNTRPHALAEVLRLEAVSGDEA